MVIPVEGLGYALPNKTLLGLILDFIFEPKNILNLPDSLGLKAKRPVSRMFTRV